ELARSCWFFVDEGRPHGGFMRGRLIARSPQAVVNGEKPHGEPGFLVGCKRAAGEETQVVAVEGHHAPASAAEAGIDAENANQSGHDDPVDSAAGGNSLGRQSFRGRRFQRASKSADPTFGLWICKRKRV